MNLKTIQKRRERVFEEIAECYECNKKQKYTTDPTDICGLHYNKMTYLLQKASAITNPLRHCILNINPRYQGQGKVNPPQAEE